MGYMLCEQISVLPCRRRKSVEMTNHIHTVCYLTTCELFSILNVFFYVLPGQQSHTDTYVEEYSSHNGPGTTYIYVS